MRRLLTAPVRARTYSRLAYLLLAFPLGVAYFVVVVVGLSLGAGLLVVWVGLPVLLGTVGLAVALAGVEARLARWLLGRDVPDPAALAAFDRESVVDPEGGHLAAVRRLLVEPTTWTSLGVALAKFVYGQVALVVVVTAVAVDVALLAAPLAYDDPATTYRLAGHVVDTLPEAVALAGVGVVGVVLTCALFDWLAGVGGRLTEELLAVGHEETVGPTGRDHSTRSR